MKRSLQIKTLIAVLAAGMMFSSCGNIDIVKRKYRPGFHVDVSKKRQKAKVAEHSATADKRQTEKMQSVDVRKAEMLPVNAEERFTASNQVAITPTEEKASTKSGQLMSVKEFKNLSFERKMKTIKNEVFKPKPRGGTEWMKWVAFGTGIAGMVFGFLALLFAFLLASSYFIWPAMIFSAAAIVFAILYRKNNGTDAKGRLGLIFGIVGGGLAIIALIVWAIWVGLALGAVL